MQNLCYKCKAEIFKNDNVCYSCTASQNEAIICSYCGNKADPNNENCSTCNKILYISTLSKIGTIIYFLTLIAIFIISILIGIKSYYDSNHNLIESLATASIFFVILMCVVVSIRWLYKSASRESDSIDEIIEKEK